MKLASNVSLMFPDRALTERLALAKNHGFDAVEILFPYELSPENLATFLESQQMQLVLINTPLGTHGEKGLACQPGRRAEFLDGLDKAIAVCNATGCQMIHVMAGCATTQHPYAEVRDTFLENMRLASDISKQHNITLNLEALNTHDVPGYFYSQPSDVIMHLELLSSPQIRLQFDFYHTQREDLDLVAELEKAMPWISHVQWAHPNGRHEPDPRDPAVRKALQVLRTQGYTGYIGCEYTPAERLNPTLAWRDLYESWLKTEDRRL